MGEEMDVGCARPSGGPVGETEETPKEGQKKEVAREMTAMIKAGLPTCPQQQRYGGNAFRMEAGQVDPEAWPGPGRQGLGGLEDRYGRRLMTQDVGS